jgi:hypothetical protein
MAFLAPLFFVGLAALAIPVLIHLTQREKKMVQQFPSLMFVRRIPYQTVRRRKLRDIALLCVRLAALLLIVGAFARPFLWRPNAATAIGATAREVVVLVDQSYSMAYGDRWDRAKAAARDAINRLGPSDRASVVLFSSGADIALRSTGEKDRLIASMESATPTAAATRFGPALKVAGSILAESPLPRKEAILISDFQRSGWRGEEGARAAGRQHADTGHIGGPADKPNASVTSASLSRSTFSDQERVTVTAAVANRTVAPVTGDSLTLEIGGSRHSIPAAQHRAGRFGFGRVPAVHGAVEEHACDRAGGQRRARNRQRLQPGDLAVRSRAALSSSTAATGRAQVCT